MGASMSTLGDIAISLSYQVNRPGRAFRYGLAYISVQLHYLETTVRNPVARRMQFTGEGAER